MSYSPHIIQPTTENVKFLRLDRKFHDYAMSIPQLEQHLKEQTYNPTALRFTARLTNKIPWGIRNMYDYEGNHKFALNFNLNERLTALVKNFDLDDVVTTSSLNKLTLALRKVERQMNPAKTKLQGLSIELLLLTIEAYLAVYKPELVCTNLRDAVHSYANSDYEKKWVNPIFEEIDLDAIKIDRKEVSTLNKLGYMRTMTPKLKDVKVTIHNQHITLLPSGFRANLREINFTLGMLTLDNYDYKSTFLERTPNSPMGDKLELLFTELGVVLNPRSIIQKIRSLERSSSKCAIKRNTGVNISMLSIYLHNYMLVYYPEKICTNIREVILAIARDAQLQPIFEEQDMDKITDLRRA